jgi:ferric enterobactin receptor
MKKKRLLFMLNQIKRIIKIISLFVLFFCATSVVYAQKSINVDVVNVPLSDVLNNVSENTGIRFAFDDDLISQIDVTFHFDNIPLNRFLRIVSEEYGLSYRAIAGTYVFYVDDNKKIDEAIEQTRIAKTETKEEAVVDTVDVIQKRIPEIIIGGVVQDKNTEEKINMCKVVLGSNNYAVTNEMGFFYKTLHAKGKYRFKIQHVGYRPVDTIIHITDDVLLDFELIPNRKIELMSSKMIPARFIIELSEVPEMVLYNPRNAIEVPGVEQNDIVNALTIIPGINYLKGVDTGLSIRGGAPSDNLVLIDGIPIIETSHLMGNLSVLNSKYIRQAFVSRGGFGAEYGGRTAGIVDLSGKTGNNKNPVVDFTANMLHTNIYVGVPVNETSSLSASFKKSFVDIWPQFLINNFALENKTVEFDTGSPVWADVDRTEVNYSDANVKLNIRPSEHTELSFNFFDSFDRQFRNYAFPTDGGYYQNNSKDSRTTGYSINLKTQSEKGWLNTFTAGYNSMTSNTVTENGKEQKWADRPVKAFFDSNIYQIKEFRAAWRSELKLKYLSHKFGGGFNYNALDYEYEDHELKIVGAKTFNDSISSSDRIQMYNTYYQAQLKPFKWLSFRVGARGTYNPQNTVFNVQPRYGIEITPFNHFKFHYSAGRYMQHMYMTYRVDSYRNVSPIWYIPGNNEQILDANHEVFGVKAQYPDLSLNVEAYSKRNRSKSFFWGEKGVQNGLDIVNYEQLKGEDYNRGIDFFMQYRTGIFKHLISYSLSESYEKINGVNNDNFFPSFDHQLHRLRLTEIVSFSGWTASVNWHFATGLPYLESNSQKENFQLGQFNDFMQLDIALEKQIDFQYFFADIGITVLNVLNRSNTIDERNISIREEPEQIIYKTRTRATAFSPLLYINLRYE